MVRFKSRYLLCEVCVEDRSSLLLLEERTIYQAVKAAVARAHGDYGSALLILSFAGVILIRCRKSHYRILWSALPFMSCLENRGQKVPCSINCLHIGGTIRTCQKFLVKYSTQQLHRMLPHCTTEAERDEVRRAVLSCSLEKERDVEEEEAEEEWDDE
ncbi:ribonuclease P/MRP protein subunit POP5 isoform X2 [Sardina pilchardus]|uniref:ribonuclease P/MRP protein subunit POP5 isoform X2 n=1 Tax=Sardina pilchardus TaxID=27697 RepID=UPI002E0DA895